MASREASSRLFRQLYCQEPFLSYRQSSYCVSGVPSPLAKG